MFEKLNKDVYRQRKVVTHQCVYWLYYTTKQKRDVPSIKENGNSPPKKQLGDMKGF